ncbi:sigma-70 family RNA polymerase sigma factor [Clostridioides difficile]|uniref:sigma-70 family RNA polymerase sigma factor n=1 Tax=Clostridioides difficile TaxID=1496 RepID=UPI000BC79BFC|nr:sigma-70 family RNA polymerase sigma factor [Clostridioides difficile]PBF40941.1 hypothetical protein BGU49_16340 [Clostridioides difficile]
MFKSLKRTKVEKYIIDNKDSFYRIAYSYTKNEEDALDVVQESMYKALYSVENIKEVNYIKTWFYKILVRTSIDFIRKNRKYNNMTDIDLIDETGAVPYTQLRAHETVLVFVCILLLVKKNSYPTTSRIILIARSLT